MMGARQKLAMIIFFRKCNKTHKCVGQAVIGQAGEEMFWRIGERKAGIFTRNRQRLMIVRNAHTSLLALHPSVLIPWENRHRLYYHKIPFNASKSQSHYSVTSFNSQNFNKKDMLRLGYNKPVLW